MMWPKSLGPNSREMGPTPETVEEEAVKEQDQSLSPAFLCHCAITGAFLFRGGVREIHNKSVPEIPPKAEEWEHTVFVNSSEICFPQSLDHLL